MSITSEYMDLLINPVLTNNSVLNNLNNNTPISTVEDTENFNEIFDNAIDMLELEVSEFSDNKKDKTEKERNKNEIQESGIISQLGSFGPPAGLIIENFDYSLL